MAQRAPRKELFIEITFVHMQCVCEPHPHLDSILPFFFSYSAIERASTYKVDMVELFLDQIA